MPIHYATNDQAIAGRTVALGAHQGLRAVGYAVLPVRLVGSPRSTRSDNGLACTAKAIWDYTAQLTDERFAREVFTTLVETTVSIAVRRREYNETRQRGALGCRPPALAAILLKTRWVWYK